MAVRARKKKADRSLGSGVSQAVDHGGSRGSQDDTRDRIAALEHERDEALVKLQAAEQRIVELEGVQEKVINQIDWVIDSLHGLKDEGK